MAIKIKCPECAHEMSLKTVKAGRFKPACTACKSTFMLVIGPGDPPPFKVAKIVATDPTVLSTTPTTTPTATATAGANTVSITATPTSATLPTVAAEAGQSSQPAATIDSHAAAKGTAPVSSHATQRVAVAAPAGAATLDRLGGYRILKELGRGGMGSVYLAKQLSLDRQVAVKTIQSDWANNPRVIARFIREAYAAAQLTHHNVVQIYDLGQDQRINYFSMELVEGGSLDDLIKRQGPLKVNEAVTYILHAARGLRFAHEHGMIHRDIKPANLMLTGDCLVKVADLGLVKTPAMTEEDQTHSEDQNLMLASARSQVTGAGSTLGTPAYMAPEQAEDAANVDHRADIYSLGCTFYALLVGKPPYSGMSALEILSKTKTIPIARVDQVVTGVPSQLASVIEKMTAKSPSDRYSSLNEVVGDLEKFLAGNAATGVEVAQQRSETLMQAAQQMQQLPAARLRRLFPWIMTAVCSLGVVLGLLISFRLALASMLVLLLTPLLISVASGLTGGGSPIARRLRAWLLSGSLVDWVTWSVGGLVILVSLWALGMIGWSIAALVLALVAAGAYFALVSRQLAKQQRPAVESAQSVLRQLRLEGKDEAAIAQFVAKFSGQHWEELFEQLFDYDLLRQMRSELGASGKLRDSKRFQPWRDALVDRIDARLVSRREERERRVLAKLETASLKAAGVSGEQAEQQAAALAESLVAAATQTRVLAAAARINMNDGAAKRDRIKQMLHTARSGKAQSVTRKATRATNAMLEQLLGSRFRFLLGSLLIAASLLWANQNGLLDKDKLSQVGQSVQQSASSLSDSTTDLQSGQAAARQATQQVSQQVSKLMQDTKPLNLPVVGELFSSLAPGMLGLLIVLSALGGSWRLSLMALLATGVTLLGPVMGVPTLGLTQGSQWISCGVGMILLCVPILVKPLR